MIGVEGVSVHAETFHLRAVTFEIAAAGWGVVIGPAGSGKTMLLEAIAGIRHVDAGVIRLRGVDATRLPPEARKLGIVYQHAHLFPHLSVAQNVAYGTDDLYAAQEVARRFGADALYERPVRSLSGGERQVVALSRALAPRPDVLLLDEAFGALDPRRRSTVRGVLRQIQREQGFTVLQVTHDFVEAGMLGDFVVVIHKGMLVQSGTPDSVFRAPASAEVADFLGVENVFGGTITPLHDDDVNAARTHRFTGAGIELVGIGIHRGGKGHAVIRSEDIVLGVGGSGQVSGRNAVDAEVEEITPEGTLARVFLRAGAASLIAVTTRAAVAELGLVPGARVTASMETRSVHLC